MYGLAAKAPKLARHPYPRRIATLLATVRRLEVTATDDALELFDTLMANELIGRAPRPPIGRRCTVTPGRRRRGASVPGVYQARRGDPL